MIGSASQVEIRITRDKQTLRTLTLEPGAISAGRDPSSDLHLDDKKVSRRHCEIRVKDGQATVMDLESRNGSYLGTGRLSPGRAATWTPELPLRVGPFVLHLTSHKAVEERPRPVPAPSHSLAQVGGRTRRISCGHAMPSSLLLKDRPITIGRSKTCDMVLSDPGLSPRHCKLELRGDQVWVTDLGKAGSTRVGNEALAAGASRVWPEGRMLQLGPFSLIQSVDAGSPSSTSAAAGQAPVLAPSSVDGSIGTRMWQEWFRQLPWLPIVLFLGSVCLVLGIGAGIFQVLTKPDPTATPVAVATPVSVSPVAATLSLEQESASLPTDTPLPLLPGTREWLPTDAPPSTPLPTLVCIPQAAGWLDLPFPYDGRNEGFGTDEQFRAASQRVAAGGRITSFLDHEYPLYKKAEQQYDDIRVRETLILFDGSRSLDKWLFPGGVGDYYSGHPGIDFSTFEWGKPTTPVLAPADGAFLGAGADNLGNNYVFLEHDQGDQGTFRTSYLHLENDGHFERMIALEPGTRVQTGERIGTMGNTGNSSGHHLHFEVRRDCNGDGLYVLAEAVDPYGFMPSHEVPTDPLTTLSCGESQYLWKYTWVSGEEGGCESPERRRQLDPTPFQGYVSIATFIFSTADPRTPTRVPIWLADADLEKVDLQTISVHRFDVQVSNWVAVPDVTLRLHDGRYFIEAFLNIPGKYTVTGKPVEDIIPPTTLVQLTGPQQDGVFTGAITVELLGQDEGEGVREIRYSIDCGKTWETYGDRPFALARSAFAVCGTAEDSEDSDEWGLEEGDYLIMAAAVDWAGNWEQPPNLQLFKAR